MNARGPARSGPRSTPVLYPMIAIEKGEAHGYALARSYFG